MGARSAQFPHVHPSAERFAARKVTVYRAAAQTAAKDGVIERAAGRQRVRITEREREMLATLVRELEIEPAAVAREVLDGATAA